jgi:ubiquinone/menaquinone biosynthesis C-methylase UbiE
MLFRRRLIKPELLDSASPEEARVNLEDLLRINRYFGGHSVIRKMLRRAHAHTGIVSILDVGAASGDTARTISAENPEAKILSLDYNSNNLRAADYPKVLGDAFHLPFADDTFDLVMCSLFLHHFTDDEVVELLREFRRTARRGVMVCDLERHILPYLFLPFTNPIFRWQRLTLHDGPISVRAAFRREELQKLAERAGLKSVDVQVHRPAFRLSVVSTKS